MRVPDRLLNCVGFVSPPNSQTYIGTTFIVGVKGKSGNAYLHAVTAKHVAEEVNGKNFLIGINFKDGEAGWFGSDMKWWYHPTEPDTVDAAATIYTPSERADVEYVPETIFATADRIKHYGIGVGDEINVVGLFTRFSGSTKHIPIVRTGNVAMMPSDKLPINGDEADVYLVEGRSIGGLSGSPVFVRHTVSMEAIAPGTGERQRISGVSQLHLLGLMRGHWDQKIGVSTIQAEAVNMGIAIVVPAQKILEVLNHPELVALREKYDRQIQKENAVK